jgi:thiamine biosynthesis protein ThiC
MNMEEILKSQVKQGVTYMAIHFSTIPISHQEMELL